VRNARPPIKWAVVGCGDIANKAVAPAINADPNSALDSFVSSSAERGRDFAERHRARTFHTDLAQMLASDVDAVYVASMVCLHKDQTVAALKAGKHVLCEKPMALDYAEAQEMTAAAKQSGRTLGVAYYRRFFPNWVRAKELAQGGAIGDVVLVRILLCGWADLKPEDPKFWRLQREKSGGGVIADVGSHRIDLVMDLLDLPVSVTALAETLSHEWAVEDAGAIIMKTRSGAHVVANFNWNCGARRDDLEILGTKGGIFLSPLNGRDFVVSTGPGQRVESAGPPQRNTHAPLVADFTQALMAGRAPRITGEEGAKTARAMDAAYASSASGEAVRLA